MAKLLSWTGTVILVGALIAVLLRGFGVPTPVDFPEREPDRVSSTVARMQVSAETAQRNLEEFEPALANLTSARDRLLYKAALEAHDIESLHDAATTYQDAIFQIRTKAAELELDTGSYEARMLMYQAGAVGQRLLFLEIFAEPPVRSNNTSVSDEQ
jgi:hypothetical protein